MATTTTVTAAAATASGVSAVAVASTAATNNAQSVTTPADATEEDCDIVEIDIPPPMEIQEHSYQSIMSTPSDSIKDGDKVRQVHFRERGSVSSFRHMYLMCFLFLSVG